MSKLKKLDLFSEEFESIENSIENEGTLSDEELLALKKISKNNLSFTRMDTINKALQHNINPLLITSSAFSDEQANAVVDVFIKRGTYMQCVNPDLTVEEIVNYGEGINPSPQRIEESFEGYKDYVEIGLNYDLVFNTQLEYIDLRFWCIECGMPLTVLSSLLTELEILRAKELLDKGIDVSSYLCPNLSSLDRKLIYFFRLNNMFSCDNLKHDFIEYVNSTYDVELKHTASDLDINTVVDTLIETGTLSSIDIAGVLDTAEFNVGDKFEIDNPLNIISSIKEKIYNSLTY